MSAWPQYTFVMVVITATLSFIAVMVWIRARRKERDAFYHNETMKTIAASGTPGAAVDYLRETERLATRRIREGLRLGGLVLVAIGVGTGFFFWTSNPYHRGYAAGAIPLLVGIAVLLYAQFLSPGD